MKELIKKIAQRLNTQIVGFGASKIREKVDKDNLLQYIAPQDLRSYGLIPEIIGRLPVLTHLNPSGQGSSQSNTYRTKKRTGETVYQTVQNGQY